jgi:hypothetical protein
MVRPQYIWELSVNILPFAELLIDMMFRECGALAGDVASGAHNHEVKTAQSPLAHLGFKHHARPVNSLWSRAKRVGPGQAGQSGPGRAEIFRPRGPPESPAGPSLTFRRWALSRSAEQSRAGIPGRGSGAAVPGPMHGRDAQGPAHRCR